MTLLGLAARNVLRNKVRATLTVLGVAISVLTFVLLRTVVGAWTAAADFAVKDRVVTRHKVTFVMTLPRRYVEDVRGAPHIKAATWANWFGGKDPKHETEFFATLAGDSKTFFTVYDDMKVEKDVLERFQQDPQGAIVGDVLAKKMGWKVGDKVLLQSSIYAKEGDWEFRIAGTYTATQKSVDRSTFVFHWTYLNDGVTIPGLKDQVGWIVSRVDDPAQAATIGVTLDKLFEDKEVQTLSQDERSFNSSFLASVSAILTAFDIISVVILAIMALLLGNTIAMGVRERTTEYGVLKAIGFRNWHVVLFIVGESTFVGLLGGLVGVLASYPIVERGLGRFLEENMGAFFPFFRIDPLAALVAFTLALMLGATAAAIPALNASRLRPIEALRRVA